MVFKRIVREAWGREKELTRDAVALRVTIMIGQTGRYFEMRRADLPLRRSWSASFQRKGPGEIPRLTSSSTPKSPQH